MRVNEATERYEYRTSNLMHSYYAVNSVDGRPKQVFKNQDSPLKQYINNVVAKAELFFDTLFTFNFTLKGIFPYRNINVLPKIKATPAYLIVNPAYMNAATAYNSVNQNAFRANNCNTTHK